MNQKKTVPITLIIPTFGRNQVLVETLEKLLALSPAAEAVIVVDQTPVHTAEAAGRLEQWSVAGEITWLRLDRPSQPHAMNVGLLAAKSEYVLFLDDDLIPFPGLLGAHLAALTDMKNKKENCWTIIGQVIQPDQVEIDFESWTNSWFPFHSNKRQFITDAMSGNLCVDRQRAISIGGFDENFFGSAFKFDSEFGLRVVRSGGKVLFEPKAGIHHLRIREGGTRAYGHHLTTWLPYHAVGKYYFGFRCSFPEAIKTILTQPIRAIRTRHHLRHPWWIPATLTAEILGICWAFMLFMKGPRLLTERHSGPHSEAVDGVPSVGHDRLTERSETDYD